MKQDVKILASTLDKASQRATPIPQLSLDSEFNLNEAYLIQKELIAKRLERGEQLSGLKLGFTSKAKMEQMGIHELIWGRLTNVMQIKNTGEMDFNKHIHPRAEPEIAFKLRMDLEAMSTPFNPLDCISGIAAAIEIIDSRYKDFKFKLEDVVADNCSSSAYVLGDWKPANTPVNALPIKMYQNNEEVQSGNSDAILGDPLASLVKGLELAKQYNVPLKKDMVILAGAATPAVYLKKGDAITVTAETLGQVQLNIGL